MQVGQEASNGEDTLYQGKYNQFVQVVSTLTPNLYNEDGVQWGLVAEATYSVK